MTPQPAFVGIGTRFEMLAVYPQVIVNRAPAETNAFKMEIDRGTLTVQRRRGEHFCRLVFYPRGHEDFNDLSTALVIPFDCIGKATRRKIKSETGLQKGEVVLFLKAYVDTRIDGLETFKIWINRDKWEIFCYGMSFLMNLQFPGWEEETNYK
jgi:hypothetical protein